MSQFRILVEDILSKALKEDNTPYENMDEIDDLMYDYERAKNSYTAANNIDNYSLWKERTTDAKNHLHEIDDKLKELTGKGYDELLDELGSIETEEDKGPKYKVGDKFVKDGELYVINKIDRHEYKSRGQSSVTYFYNVESLESLRTDSFFDSYMRAFGFRPATQKDIEWYEEKQKIYKQAEQNAPYKIGDKFVKDGFYNNKQFTLYSIKADGDLKNPTLYYHVKNDELERHYMFTSYDNNGWELVKAE